MEAERAECVITESETLLHNCCCINSVTAERAARSHHRLQDKHPGLEDESGYGGSSHIFLLCVLELVSKRLVHRLLVTTAKCSEQS